MYGFSEDETLLLFIDCFGLTRLSRPKKVKTDRKITGSDSAGIATVSRDGTAAGSYEDLWNKSVLWSFPELKSSTRFDRFREKGLVVHPDGRHYLVPEYGKLTITPMFKGPLLPLRLDAAEIGEDEDDKPAEPVSFDLGGGEQLDDLVLGDRDPDVPATLRIAHDGTLLCWHGATLIRGQLDTRRLTIEWRRKVRTPERARIDAYADNSRTVFVLHRGRRWTIVEQRPDASERRFEIESLAVPIVAGRWLAYQPEPDLVIRRDLDSDAQSEHSLDIYDKNRKIDLRHPGPGTIFAGPRGSLLFLPGHRESILDLEKRLEIARSLPAKELELRQAILGNARRYCDPARAAGVTIELGRIDLNSKYNSVGVTHRVAGAGSLAGALLGGCTQSAWAKVTLPGRWRMGGYGSHGGISYNLAASVDEVIDCYATLASAGIHFAGTIGFWADLFDRRTSGRSYSDEAEQPCEPAAAALLARALLAVIRDGAAAELDHADLAARGVPSVEEVIAGLARYPQRVDELDHTTTRLASCLFNHLHGPDAARIWVDVVLEPKGWPHYGSHYSDFASYGVLRLIDAHPQTAEVFRAWLAEHGLPTDDRRWAVEQVQQRVGG